MNLMAKDFVDLVRALAWPVVVLSLTYAFRREVRALFRVVVERASKISGLGMEIELAANQVASERRLQLTSPDEKAKALRDLELAKAAARRFDYWMRNYNHQPSKSHRDELLDWLVFDQGARYLFDDYGVFKALAEVLSLMGYETTPAPPENEFKVKLTEANEREKSRPPRY